MGGGSSKDLKIDSAGQVNTNIVVEDTVNVHNQQFLIILWIICAIKIIEIIMRLARNYGKGLKKKYSNTSAIV